MFINLFPQSLAAHITQQWPHQQLQCIMLRLVSVEQYCKWKKNNTPSKHLLHPKEQDRLESYHLKKRRDEWLTGRICAKIAARNFLGDVNFPAKRLIITNTANGRPSLKGQIPKQLHCADISLSHGAGYGLAAVATQHCGVDVERITRNFNAIQNKFCTFKEIHYMSQHAPELTRQQCLALLWIAKEANKKALSSIKMPGFLDLQLKKLTRYNKNWTLDFIVQRYSIQQPQTISVAATLLPDAGIAVSILPTNHHA